MAKKNTDFTAADKTKYSPIGAANTENTENTTTTTKREYHRLDPRQEAPKEYRFTARSEEAQLRRNYKGLLRKKWKGTRK